MRKESLSAELKLHPLLMLHVSFKIQIMAKWIMQIRLISLQIWSD